MSWALRWLTCRHEIGWKIHSTREAAITAGKAMLAEDREHELVEVAVTETIADDRGATIWLRGGDA